MMQAFYILLGLAGLGLMVIIHEWGHYVAARFFGVRILTFSVGFGPRLFGIKRGPTDFCVRAIPLGGYVKMAGENVFEELEGAPDEFQSKPRWQRSIIAFAGPFVNIVAAVLILFVLYQFTYQKLLFLEEPALIHAIAEGSPAEQVGLQPGDLVVEIGMVSNPTWEDLIVETVLTGDAPNKVTVQREEATLTFSIPSDMRPDNENPMNIGWMPYNPVVIREVEEGTPAHSGGLAAGDEIVAVDGLKTSAIGGGGLIRHLQEKAGDPVEIRIRRNFAEFTTSLAAVKATKNGIEAYYLGISLTGRILNTRLGPAEALRQSLTDNGKFLKQMGQLFDRLVFGTASIKTVQGPIGIVGLLGQAARIGIPTLIGFLALISINLGVINLLPIPILDGGHIVTFAVEGILRRDLSLRLKERFLQLGFLALMMLFAVVMYNDVRRYFFQ